MVSDSSAAEANRYRALSLAVRIIVAVAITFVFLTSVRILSAAFEMAGKDVVDGILSRARNPFVGIFCGILVTSLLQSSSVTTCMLVGLVSSGQLPLQMAIPVVMGANIGTTVTNTLVAMGHVTRLNEFRRAIACSTMHDFFNMLCVIALLPIEMATGFLRKTAYWLATIFHGVGGDIGKGRNLLKEAMTPFVDFLRDMCHGLLGERWGALLMGIIGLVALFLTLWGLVRVLKSLMLGRVENFIDRYLDRHGPVGILVGAGATAAVQSSSVTTSFFVPLAAAGVLRPRQIYPMILGANLGTTITALLASLAGDINGLTLAFTHLLFNICGILLFYPIPQLRIPIWLAQKFGRLAVRRRFLAIAYVVVAFYVIPLLLMIVAG